jgi:hypothetical protein
MKSNFSLPEGIALYLDDLKWLMHGSSMLWFGFVSSR